MTRTDSSNHDERTFYRKLLKLLHPDGLACPRCGSRHFNQVSSDYATSVPSYWCSDCTRCFDAWTGTLLQGACCPASEVYRELLCVLRPRRWARIAQIRVASRRRRSWPS